MAIRPYQLCEMAILEFILATRNHPASHEGLGDEGKRRPAPNRCCSPYGVAEVLSTDTRTETDGKSILLGVLRRA